MWASGSDPGFITETLLLALLSVQRHVDLIEIEEFGDLSRRPSRHMVIDQRRFGTSLEDFDPDRRKNHLFGEYEPALTVLADIAGLGIDEWTAEGGVAAAKENLHIAAGEIQTGTAAAQRIIINGRSRGTDRIRFIQCAFVAMDTEPDRGLQPTGWRVRLHGDAPLDLSTPFPVCLDDNASVVPAFNAYGLVDAISYVCASAQNILTTEELPHILARGPRPVDGQGATLVGDLGPLTRKVMQYQDLMKQFVPTARAAQDWAPLANSYRLPLRTHRKVPLSPRLVPAHGDAQSIGTFNRHIPDHGQADFRAARPRVLRN